MACIQYAVVKIHRNEQVRLIEQQTEQEDIYR